MSKIKVVLYGTGKFAEYISYVFHHDDNLDVSGFCVEKKYLKEKVEHFESLPVISFEDIESVFPPQEYQLFIAVGNNIIRERIFYLAKNKGYSLISYVSPNAIVYDDLKYKENVFISDASGIMPFVTIGHNTILIGSQIGHHSTIGDHVLLSRSYIAGNVKIGDGSFLGLNSTVKQNVTIGKYNIIGMGCSITNDTQDREIYSNPKPIVTRSTPIEKIQTKFL